jgi:hypothetical protein
MDMTLSYLAERLLEHVVNVPEITPGKNLATKTPLQI